jgi:cytoskeleton protein RodZ
MPPTIGETLTQARLDKKLTIKAASEATAIRVKFLEALEADEFDSLPSPVQARGFLRIYADYLGLDSGDLLILLMGESTSVEESTEDSVSQPETPVEESDLPETSENEIKVPLAEEVERQSTDVDFVELPSVDLGEDDLDIQSQNFNLPLPLSSSIFIEIGQQLRGRRELLSLTFDEIEQHTHIRKHYLLSLEAGAIDNLPSPVQARGILSSYARFLDLDSESLLLRFAEGLQAKRLERHPRQPRTKHENGGDAILPPGLRRILSTDLVFGGSMILAMIAFAIWGANRIISQSEFAQGSVNSEQSISEALLAPTLATEEATVLPSPSLEVVITSVNVNNTPTIIEIPTLAKSSPVQVVTAITGNTWMRVKVDGEIKFQGIANAGSAYTFNGEEKIEVRAADGSLVQIFYNGKDQGLMGDSGAITEIIYNSQEALLPTPTSTPTPTRTPRVTPTYTPSITPTPTDLPEPSE